MGDVLKYKDALPYREQPGMATHLKVNTISNQALINHNISNCLKKRIEPRMTKTREMRSDIGF